MDVFVRFMASVPDAMILVEPTGVIRAANAQAETLLGYPPGGLEGVALDALMPEATRAQHAAHVRAFFGSPTQRTMGSGRRLSARRRNGTEFPADIAISAIQLDGRPWGVAVLRDLTTSLAQERATQQLLELAQMGTWTLDLTTQVMTLSDELRRLLGQPALRGEDIPQQFHPEDAAVAHAAWTRLLDTGEPQAVPACRMRHADGSWRHLEGRMYVERASNGAMLRVHGISMDVTRRVELEAAERRARELLVTSDRMASLGLLAASLAHEINNPMTAVMGGLRAATDEVQAMAGRGSGEPLGELRSALEEALDAAERVRQIVRDLRVFSHDEPRTYAVELNPALESALRMTRNEVRHRADLVTSFAEVPPVRATHARVGQVMVNLVLNAAQAMPQGESGRRSIRVSTRHAGGTEPVVVEVADTGPGIPPDIQDKLFTPFFTTKPGGTGLGLSISRRIARDLGGDLVLESTPGQGTTVRVTFPVTAPPRTPPLPVPSVGAAPRRRILVVDDDPVVASSVQRGLRVHHEVDVLHDAAEALVRLQGGAHYDAILCDLMMPGMNGKEFLDGLRGVSAELANRVAFITGGAYTDWARLFLESVPNPRLQKPFAQAELRDLVRTLLDAVPPAT